MMNGQPSQVHRHSREGAHGRSVRGGGCGLLSLTCKQTCNQRPRHNYKSMRPCNNFVLKVRGFCLLELRSDSCSDSKLVLSMRRKLFF